MVKVRVLAAVAVAVVALAACVTAKSPPVISHVALKFQPQDAVLARLGAPHAVGHAEQETHTLMTLDTAADHEYVQMWHDEDQDDMVWNDHSTGACYYGTVNDVGEFTCSKLSDCPPVDSSVVPPDSVYSKSAPCPTGSMFTGQCDVFYHQGTGMNFYVTEDQTALAAVSSDDDGVDHDLDMQLVVAWDTENVQLPELPKQCQ